MSDIAGAAGDLGPVSSVSAPAPADSDDEIGLAYRTLIRTGRIGVFFTLSFASMLLYGLGIGVYVVMHHLSFSELQSGTWTAATTIAVTLFYAIMAIPLFLVPRSALRTVMQGNYASRRIAGLHGGMYGSALFVSMIWYMLDVNQVALAPTGSNISVVWSVLFFSPIVAPICEELVFQGWLQTRLERFGRRTGLVCTTLLFLGFHFPTEPYAFLRSVVLLSNGYIRMRSRSLFAAIISHSTYNVLIFLLLCVEHIAVHGTL
jgi:membrane protease YdiL (CAAX protease family)